MPRLRLRVRTMMLLIVLISLPLGFVAMMARLLGTEYAPGYSQAGFNAVRFGQDRRQVEALLGNPFRVTFGGSVATNNGRTLTNTTRYEYSRSPIDRSYEMRDVWFDSSGRVADKWDNHWDD